MIKKYIYFDNAATSGSKPPCVINAVTNTLKCLSANPGRSGHPLALRAAALAEKVRASAACFFNADDPGRVIFCHNCTDALNLAILGGAKKGHVITTAMEHNSVLRPLFELEREGIISLTVVPPGSHGSVTADAICRAFTPATYLVAVTHTGNVTGARNPIAEIGRAVRGKGALLLVDGAQGAGYSPISMKSDYIDILAVAGHKGLKGPLSLGLLLFNERASIRPVRFGGTGTYGDSVYQPEEPPEGLESGTLPLPLIAGLNAALGYCQSAEGKAGVERMSRLSDCLYERLREIDGVQIYSPPCSRGVVSFNINDYTSQETADILSGEYGICARPGMHCAPLMHKHLGTLTRGAVRVSLSGDNTFEEIEFFIQAVKEIAD